MRQRQREAEVQPRAGLGNDVAMRLGGIQHQFPSEALLVVDGAEGPAQQRVEEADLRGDQAVDGSSDVLIVRQRVELVIEGELGLEVEPARQVVDEDMVVAEAGSVALAAALGRPEQVVEVGTVPGQAAVPAEVAVIDVQVPLFPGGHLPVDGVCPGDSDCAEPERVLEIETPAQPQGILVALHDGIGPALRRAQRAIPRLVGIGRPRFKRQFGAVIHALDETILRGVRRAAPDLNPTNPGFARARRLWRALPLAATRRLSPLLMRGIG